MDLMSRGGSWFVVGVLAAVSSGCGSSSKANTVNATRGQYLVEAVLVCGDCHTTPQANGLPSFNPADFLGGGREFAAQAGSTTQKFYAANLTSDPDHGLGKWTDDQIKRAMTRGIDNKNNALFPIMPYWVFGNMNDDDLTSIVKYLRTLPPNPNAVPEDTFSIVNAAQVVDAASVPHTTLPASDPMFATAERGRYIAGLMGACISCHTPTKSLDQPIDVARAFTGGQLFPLGPITTVSANLTPDATGLAGWTASEVVSTLQKNQERGRGRPLCPPMPAGPNRAGDMTPEDLAAVAAYITTLQPAAHGPFGCTDGGVPYGLDGAF